MIKQKIEMDLIQPSIHIKTTMTNGQDEINEYLNKHFHEEFLGQEYLSQFNNQEDAEEVFDKDFEYRYNSDEGFNIDLGYIRSKCDFLTTMKIIGDFQDHDKILKKYIYFYLREEWYGYMITELIPEHPYE